MDKVMVTILLLVAGIVCSMVVLNAAYPAITGTSAAVVDAGSKIGDRITTDIEIIEMTHNGTDVTVWIKNIGTSRILGINKCDIFFGPQGNFARINYGTMVNPYWEYTFENDTQWGPTSTLKITLHYGTALSGEYYFKISVPNGVYEQTYYSAL